MNPNTKFNTTNKKRNALKLEKINYHDSIRPKLEYDIAFTKNLTFATIHNPYVSFSHKYIPLNFQNTNTTLIEARFNPTFVLHNFGLNCIYKKRTWLLLLHPDITLRMFTPPKYNPNDTDKIINGYQPIDSNDSYPVRLPSFRIGASIINFPVYNIHSKNGNNFKPAYSLKFYHYSNGSPSDSAAYYQPQTDQYT